MHIKLILRLKFFRAMAEPGDLSYFGLSPKKSRAKESSKYFGVRFRPDLQKWVAEIRVAEWKSVDKKVWLGTFDSEEGAARAVDAARKLLKCKKKRGFNIPSAELDAYSEKIPSNLKLTNLLDDSMFKEVTLFVKKRAQEYASSFTSGQVFTSSDYQVQPDLSYFDVNLLQRIGDPLQEEVSCLASQSSALHGLELYNDQTCAVIAASYPCSCFSSLNNFSPPSCVSDGRCSSLDASNEAQENLLQAYEDACYRRGAGGSDWQNFGSYSSPNSNVESQHETDTTYDHVLLEEQGLGCSGNMRNAGHSSDFWDVIDECMFDNQVHWGRHHSAMDLTTGDEVSIDTQFTSANKSLTPQL